MSITRAVFSSQQQRWSSTSAPIYHAPFGSLIKIDLNPGQRLDYAYLQQEGQSRSGHAIHRRCSFDLGYCSMVFAKYYQGLELRNPSMLPLLLFAAVVAVLIDRHEEGSGLCSVPSAPTSVTGRPDTESLRVHTDRQKECSQSAVVRIFNRSHVC